MIRCPVKLMSANRASLGLNLGIDSFSEHHPVKSTFLCDSGVTFSGHTERG